MARGNSVFRFLVTNFFQFTVLLRKTVKFSNENIDHRIIHKKRSVLNYLINKIVKFNKEYWPCLISEVEKLAKIPNRYQKCSIELNAKRGRKADVVRPKYFIIIFQPINLFTATKNCFYLSPAFFHDSLKFEFFGTSLNKSSLIKKN
ncbi:hypothetical protein BpHYR1_034257 [Brachionus plicatilis]|uniref:Uncharacterized protein n=1 Tax=Brachionus plicatilis TaxID=10195 RepID=A0A3M7RAF0_BRAPC|nr:hypothetical protein BpHYR1_034257 [Brachionus plicatilis]